MHVTLEKEYLVFNEVKQMPKYQAWNPRIEAWVKYKFGKQGFQIIDVKEQNPTVPFKGIPKRGNLKK